MFNLEEYVKKTLVELYDKKVYIGAKVRELSLNYLVKGLISQETVMYIDEYITKAETVVEVEEPLEEPKEEPLEETVEEPIETVEESEVEE